MIHILNRSPRVSGKTNPLISRRKYVPIPHVHLDTILINV
jgi:hypothetical protein